MRNVDNSKMLRQAVSVVFAGAKTLAEMAANRVGNLIKKALAKKKS